MKKLTFYFCLLALLWGISLMGQVKDDNYSFQYNGKDYEVVKEMRSFANAAADAVNKGGHLVHIDDFNEDAAMYDAIMDGAEIPFNYTVVNDGGAVAYVWIGATDQNEEGTWLWDGNNDNAGVNFWNGEGNAGAGGGSAVGGAYFNWGGAAVPNEPDNWSNQDAAAIGLEGWPSGSGALGSVSQWNDIDISNELYYVIEYEPAAINDVINIHDEIEVFPNPVKDQIYIQCRKEPGNLTIQIFDINGRKMVEKKCENRHSEMVDLSFNSSGIYQLIIIDEDGKMRAEKILKK